MFEQTRQEDQMVARDLPKLALSVTNLNYKPVSLVRRVLIHNTADHLAGSSGPILPGTKRTLKTLNPDQVKRFRSKSFGFLEYNMTETVAPFSMTSQPKLQDPLAVVLGSISLTVKLKANRKPSCASPINTRLPIIRRKLTPACL